MKPSNIEVLVMFLELHGQAALFVQRIGAAMRGESGDMLPAITEGLRELPQIIDGMKKLPKPKDKQFAKSIKLFRGGMVDLLRAVKNYKRALEKGYAWRVPWAEAYMQLAGDRMGKATQLLAEAGERGIFGEGAEELLAKLREQY